MADLSINFCTPERISEGDESNSGAGDDEDTKDTTREEKLFQTKESSLMEVQMQRIEKLQLENSQVEESSEPQECSKVEDEALFKDQILAEKNPNAEGELKVEESDLDKSALEIKGCLEDSMRTEDKLPAEYETKAVDKMKLEEHMKQEDQMKIEDKMLAEDKNQVDKLQVEDESEVESLAQVEVKFLAEDVAKDMSQAEHAKAEQEKTHSYEENLQTKEDILQAQGERPQAEEEKLETAEGKSLAEKEKPQAEEEMLQKELLAHGMNLLVEGKKPQLEEENSPAEERKPHTEKGKLQEEEESQQAGEEKPQTKEDKPQAELQACVQSLHTESEKHQSEVLNPRAEEQLPGEEKKSQTEEEILREEPQSLGISLLVEGKKPQPLEENRQAEEEKPQTEKEKVKNENYLKIEDSQTDKDLVGKMKESINSEIEETSKKEEGKNNDDIEEEYENSEEEEEEEDSEAEEESSQETASEQEEEEISEDDGEDILNEDKGSAREADGMTDVSEKRIMGDGEEEPDVKIEKKLDDDEDKTNPAYIPRKGAFYEHDLRLDADEERDKLASEQKLSNKKLWVDEHKWQHDRFDSRFQAPKSPQELVNAYGFDIRRGREDDIPMKNSKPRGRRPGQRSRFGDYVPRQVKDVEFDEDGRNHSRRNAQDRHRNERRNNEFGVFQGHRELEQEKDSASNLQNDFPPLMENTDRTKDVNAVESMTVHRAQFSNSENQNKPEVAMKRPECQGSREEANDGHAKKDRFTKKDTEHRDFRNYENDRNKHELRANRSLREMEGDHFVQPFERSRGGKSRDYHNPFSYAARSRGGRRGRWQRDQYEPGGRYANVEENNKRNENEEFHERNNQVTYNRYPDYRAQQGPSESYQNIDRKRENRSFRESDLRHGNENGEMDGLNAEAFEAKRGREGPIREQYKPRGGEWEHNRYANKDERHDHQQRRGQDHGYRGQRPWHDNDYNDKRNRPNSHPETFATRTIQNSNIVNRPHSDARPHDEGKQEALNSVSVAVTRMTPDEQNSKVKQQSNSASRNNSGFDESNLRGDHRPAEQFDQRKGSSQFPKPPAQEKLLHKDQTERTFLDGNNRGGNSELGHRKTSVVIQTTDSPEMLPPVTSVPTYSRPSDRPATVLRLAGSERTENKENKGWAGGEFTPAWRLQSASASKAENMNPAPSGKPKRYSTQRQKAAGADAAYTESLNADYQETGGVVTQSLIQPLTTALPARPLPAATYYDSTSSYAAPSFHPAQGLPLGMHGMSYQMPNLPHSPYGNQPMMNNPQLAKPGNQIHNMYIPSPGSMLPPNPYMSMPSVMNYPSHFQMASVQIPPGGATAHLHHGSMQDQEQVDIPRMVYFNQQGIPLSLMHPQFIDQGNYMNETNSVDHNIGPQGYVESHEVVSPSQAQQEY